MKSKSASRDVKNIKLRHPHTFTTFLCRLSIIISCNSFRRNYVSSILLKKDSIFLFFVCVFCCCCCCFQEDQPLETQVLGLKLNATNLNSGFTSPRLPQSRERHHSFPLKGVVFRSLILEPGGSHVSDESQVLCFESLDATSFLTYFLLVFFALLISIHLSYKTQVCCENNNFLPKFCCSWMGC